MLKDISSLAITFMFHLNFQPLHFTGHMQNFNTEFIVYNVLISILRHTLIKNLGNARWTLLPFRFVK